MNSRIRQMALLALSMALVSSCVSTNGRTGTPPANASFELPSVRFKPGRPLHGESLQDALVDPAMDELGKLKIGARDLKRIPVFQVEVLGATDDAECAGRECFDLSTRRARLVYEYLVGEGVPKDSLYAFKGFGTRLPINANENEAERQRSRRAELHVIRTSFGRGRSFIDEP